MEEIEVPHYFLCPISLDIMKDPVTLPSGITYDRHSIETWLFSDNHSTCPVTKLPISPDSDSDSLTPNHTLRRLIQAWCTLHSSHGIQRFPTPKPPVTKPQILKLISSASSSSSPSSHLSCIRRLRSLASDSEANRRSLQSAGAPEFLASLVASSDSAVSHEALSTLHNLRLSDSKLKTLTSNNGEFFDSLTRVMQQGTYESRAYAVLVLKSMVEVADSVELSFLKSDFFVEIVGVLKDQTTSPQSLKAALKVLIVACPWGRNRVKAVEAGGVGALVEILLAAAAAERRVCEMALTVVDLLCGCADGRAALLGHGGGMAVVSKKILRVSQVGSERAVRILFSIAKYSGSPAVLAEMAVVGIVAKLCLVLQVESGNKTKEKAKEILKMHARVWRNSPCIPSKLVSSYPAN